MREAVAARAAAVDPGPELAFGGVDTLWIQIAGTVCNIACRHCFISCGPRNRSHEVMETRRVLEILDRARDEGVRDYYFTGGEPFLHPDILLLAERTLTQGPLGILTNALLIERDTARALGRLFRKSEYSFDLRVSVDGVTAAENDPIRGRGTFVRILEAARHLARAGVSPVFTVTTVHASYEEDAGRLRFVEHLEGLGFERPRVKFIPPFRIGREARRAGAYDEDARLAEGDLLEGEADVLLCGSSRTITANGVFPCPILIEEPSARMGAAWEDGLRPIRLSHPACVTCHREGFSCRT